MTMRQFENVFRRMDDQEKALKDKSKRLVSSSSLTYFLNFSATVDLASARGRFEFDASVTAPDLIKEYVDDLGFTADVVTAGEREIVSKCGVEVEGMTCQSCVNNIEGTIGKLNGVKDIKV